MGRRRLWRGLVGRSDETRGFSTEGVLEHFERATGHRLIVTNRFESRPILSGWDSLEPERPMKEFGSFGVGVFYDIEKGKAEGLLGGLAATKEGVYWEHHIPEHGGDPYWSATKLYSNVQVIWWSRQKKLDRRWRRLDQVFSGLSAR